MGWRTLFQYLAHDPNVGEVSILAHSMGNWLALEWSAADGHSQRRASGEIQECHAGRRRRRCRRVPVADRGHGSEPPGFTLFVSRDDRALAASKRVWGNVDRLGAIDPQQSPYKEELVANDISVIDLTNVKSDDALRHSKFAESPEVVQLIGARLASGQTLTDSHVGFGDTILSATTETAARLGTGIGLAVAAPVALIDQDTRNNYGKHVQSLRGTTTRASSGQARKAKCKADNSGNRPCA